MKLELNQHRQNQRGQTLFIALVVMAILLVLGFVFTGIVNRNILQAATAQRRSVANDLSEAGIRYAHSQLLNSRLGADWRGELVDLAPVGTDTTLDPDMLYLRPGTGFGLRSDTDTVIDRGGPDGLGFYTRAPFDNGRALIRVRWAPSDSNIFQGQTVGQLRNPGAARHYLIIESIGRVGRVNPNDPTTLGSTTPIQFRNFANSTDFRNAFNEMVEADKKLVRTRKLIAFAQIGLTDQAMFITNKDKVSRSADVGVPEALGAVYENLAVRVPLVLGSNGVVPPSVAANVPYGGGLRSNASVVLHGRIDAFLNSVLGDVWQVAGNIAMDNGGPNNIVNVATATFNGAVWTPLALQTVQPDSRNSGFSTLNGLIRDGDNETDANGWWRNVGVVEAPSVLSTDAQNGQNRYLLLTRDSGSIGVRGNIGRFGHGSGVYVSNTQDRQGGYDEAQREDIGAAGSLVYDWFNPNNGQQNSGWKGSFYIPRGAFVQLTNDGFIVTRDGAATGNERTWRRPDGSDSGSSTIRYRLRYVGGVPYIVNTYTPGVNINGLLADPDFLRGRPFNGVLYFEGNVRVRGVIPTDHQLTLVSNATVYIEGSITKGVTDPISGSRLNRPSRSSLMLMAKDYVALNTTMFFGPAVNQNLRPNGSAVEVPVGGDTLELMAEMLLDPDTTGASANPSLWNAYGNTYQEFGSGNAMTSDLLVSHTMANGSGQYTMVGMDVNEGLGGQSTYLFSLLGIDPNPQTNSVLNIAPYGAGYVTPGFTIANFVPIYGLGREPWQRASKFETMSYPLASNASTFTYPFIQNTTGEGNYRLLAGDTNYFKFRHVTVGTEPTNDYLLKKAAIVPHDIRVEASVFAEQGSYVVIPGPWFNGNSGDTRERFDQRLTDLTNAGITDAAERVRIATADRLRDFGNGPKTPFYGEPLNVRVQVFGSISQNMPLPMSYQAEWLRKWGWMPRQIGSWYTLTGSSATPVLIPAKHVPAGYDLSLGNPTADRWVPNLITTYDPMLATGRVNGFLETPANPYVRLDNFGRPLPPMPRLPVSPTLAYFGEVSQ